MQQEQKLIWADNLRVIATVSVILLHVAAPILYNYGDISNYIWWVGNSYDSAVRFCVPVFVMLTGTLLLRKEEKLGVFFKKRLVRVIIPFLFWSFIYIAFNLTIAKLTFGNDKTFFQTMSWIGEQLKFGSSYHLWYVYMIIGIYLITPIIGKWIRNASEKEILYFLLIWLITAILSFPIFYSFRFIDLMFFAGFIGYLVLGYYLAQLDDLHILNKLAPLLFIAGILITAFGTYYLAKQEGEFNELLYDPLFINVISASIGIFLLGKRIRITNPKFIKLRDLISKYSYGIYLVHILILTLLEAAGIYWNFIDPLVGIPITTIICLILSTTVIYLLHKLPFGSYIAG